MVFVLLSICCSVIVSILLKLAKRYEINIPQAVVWNYPVAAFFTFIIYRPDVAGLHITTAPVTVYLLLGILLPSLFVILGLSVRYTGIVRTDLAQRLSLFIPLLTAFLFFKEQVSTIKLAGIIMGFIAIVCTIPWQKGTRKSEKLASWIYPLMVFAGMGVIDVLFKQIAVYRGLPYTTSLFIVLLLAFIISVITLVLFIITGKARFNWVNFVSGLILGFFNFGNILFYLKAHRALPENPSLVFSAMNIGVIVAGAIVGVFLFKERLSIVNKIGIVIAVISILVISLAG